MKFDKFLGQVQHLARLSDIQQALRATRATLQTLAERIDCNEARDMAAQLPPEIGKSLHCPQQHKPDRFGLDEFFRRVSEREGVDLADATFHARAVMEVLIEAVSPGEMGQVMQQLPDEFQPLFFAGTQGKL